MIGATPTGFYNYWNDKFPLKKKIYIYISYKTKYNKR